MTTPTYTSPLVESMISTAARSILDEIGIDFPTASESAEVRQLAETIVRETVDALAGPRRLSIGMRESLLDVADLVTTDPETASVDQIHEVAIALRDLLDLHIPARVDRQ